MAYMTCNRHGTTPQTGCDALNTNNEVSMQLLQVVAGTGLAHRKGEVVKHLCAIPPCIRVAILSLAFIIEAVNLQQGTHSVKRQPSDCMHGVVRWPCPSCGQGVFEAALPWQRGAVEHVWEIKQPGECIH